jgi:hypothetical protein
MTAESFTNSSLACARLCPRKYELQFNQRLERDFGFLSEALAVGSCWHLAHDVQTKGGNPYEAIAKHAPSLLWSVKLSRLFSAYGWYWHDNQLALVESEKTFRIEVDLLNADGSKFILEGQIDGKLRTPDGRRGNLERKTTSEAIDDASDYWKHLRLDAQVGIYGIASGRPDFILYDVVKKPTIRPARIVNKEVDRMKAELAAGGIATYYGEKFPASRCEIAVTNGQENELLYGARLTADIGDRPETYFARRIVTRTQADYEQLERELYEQVDDIRSRETRGSWPRNPDACDAFGTCAFFSLCSNNILPVRGSPPAGFRRRTHLHPELVRTPEASPQPEAPSTEKRT